MYHEIHSIPHIGTSVEIMYEFGSKNTVWDHYLTIIVSKKYGCQYVHFFHNQLKFARADYVICTLSPFNKINFKKKVEIMLPDCHQFHIYLPHQKGASRIRK